jgi:hypothetical protein
VRTSFGRTAASGAGAEVRRRVDCVVLRGHLNGLEDRAATLDLDGSLILLDLVAPLPEGVADSWVEIRIKREKVALYPYEL